MADLPARRQYLDSVCAGNPRLRQEVESLLAAHEQAGDFLKAPAAPEPIGKLAEVIAPGPSMSRSFRDYEIIEEVARGGMGVVYKARQVSLNRPVALKMILAGRLAADWEVKRFRLEVEATARLVHPNIVGIFEAGEHDGQPYFSMPYVEGRSLQRVMEDGTWNLDDPAQSARLLAKVARAVHFAHERGIVHRDLKPGNILLDAQGEPHITDFGLAKLLSSDSRLTVSWSVMGTPSFMAPEQAAGHFHKLTPAADLYSLGAVLYYLLTGRPPFLAETPLDILVQVLDQDALQPRTINAKVSRDLERICLRCLEKSPERRYPSAAALAADLERFLRGEPVELPRGDTSSRLRQWARQRPALVARLIALTVVAMISHIAYVTWLHRDAARHWQVMGVLGLWALACVLCQRALVRPRWANLARFCWVGADVTFLTALLHIDDALESPLVAFYPALIVGSGLWLRVSLVRLTTQLCGLGYASLVVVQYGRPGSPQHLHWHLIFLAMLALTGFVVAYYVHRVSVLCRLCESRPDP